MNIKKLIISALCLTLGCSQSNSDPNVSEGGVPWEQLASAPRVDVPKKSLPEWLVFRITHYYETRPSIISKVLIYKGEWDKQVVYFILDIFSSCLCDFFTENGERIVDASDCRATSKNWVIIYEYGEVNLNLGIVNLIYIFHYLVLTSASSRRFQS